MARRQSRGKSETSAAPAGLPELLTADEVAAWLKTTVGAVYAKAERGNLPGATRLGRRLYFVRDELLALVEKGRIVYVPEEAARAGARRPRSGKG